MADLTVAPNPDTFLSAAHFLLPGNAGNIEITTSAPAAEQVQKIVVICHPHPLYGGSMDNKVVTTLMRTFNEMDCATLRFNFRGVGQSEGQHDHGYGEADDVVTILKWVNKVLPHATIWLAGFSFGSYVAYRVATTSEYKNRIQHLILVAPPVTYPEFKNLPTPTMPWLVVQGEADEVIDSTAVFAWCAQFTPPPQLIRMAETSHFFHGKLVELKNNLIKALS